MRFEYCGAAGDDGAVHGVDARLGCDLDRALGLGLLIRNQERCPRVDLPGGERRRRVSLLQRNTFDGIDRHSGLCQSLERDVLALACRVDGNALAGQICDGLDAGLRSGDDAGLVLVVRVGRGEDADTHVLGQCADDGTVCAGLDVEFTAVEEFEVGAESRCGLDPFDLRAQRCQRLVVGSVTLADGDGTGVSGIENFEREVGAGIACGAVGIGRPTRHRQPGQRDHGERSGSSWQSAEAGHVCGSFRR